MPAQRTAHSFGIRIEQHLIGVEAVPMQGLEGTVHPVPVELSRHQIGEVAVPDRTGPVRQHRSEGWLLSVRTVEQTQLHPAGMVAVQGKIDAQAVPSRT